MDILKVIEQFMEDIHDPAKRMASITQLDKVFLDGK
jgi:hypothetical protein